MLTLQGPVAHGPGSAQKLLQRIQRHNPRILAVQSRFLHFVKVQGAGLGPREQEILRSLLHYGVFPETETMAPDQRLIAIPRWGTISPWATKATEIAHACGLTAIARIERGVSYALHGDVDAVVELCEGLHDRMTQALIDDERNAAGLFEHSPPEALVTVALGDDGTAALRAENARMGLSLSTDEIDYLVHAFGELGRDPTDVELMMFAQANSEHCRHKIFNARYVVDGEPQPQSLFAMVRHTTERSPASVLSAYRDNAAVIAGHPGQRLFPDPADRVYRAHPEAIHILMKVETHNHPTAISPFPGAATGAGGEIRDEGATGRGAKPKAGLCGFSVSHLRLPDAPQPWEDPELRPTRIASPLQIMIDGPLGAAAFNNEFGRPNLAGYFRTFELSLPGAAPGELRAYHKPIMLAGGLGNIRAEHVKKGTIPLGAPLLILGGPAMKIGLGGGAASSAAQGEGSEQLDFASVQRGNPEMQRRCQEVIDRCWELGPDNPIASIHDVGAGGLSNALPELVADSGRGGHFRLRDIPNLEPGMSPLSIWCNEAQERYVIALYPERLAQFSALCAREACPFAVVGHASDDGQLTLDDSHFERQPIDLPLSVLLGKAPRMTRKTRRTKAQTTGFSTAGIDLQDALSRVLQLPTVADKTFLITIGDRTITGLVHRDPMVGRFQVPVADAAVTLSDYQGFCGEAMAVGERPPIALLDAAAAARVAVAEAITNLAGCDIAALADIKLSCNWMAAAGHGDEDARLFDAVSAVGLSLCPALGIAVPVGKDSMSMKTVWREGAGERAVTSPLSLIVSAFAPVIDVRRTLTPELRRGEPSRLLLVDLGRGRARLGGSCLAQTYKQLGDQAPDLDSPEQLRAFFQAVTSLNRAGKLLAYHDRSDGGLIVTLLEMAFAAGVGLDIDIATLHTDPIAALFNEELGAVLQVRDRQSEQILELLAAEGLTVHDLGAPRPDAQVFLRCGRHPLFEGSLHQLRRLWSSTTHHMQRLRDDPQCADEEQAARLDPAARGLYAELTFDPDVRPSRPKSPAPRVAILRDQGVNGQLEMAAAFVAAGFVAVDVHMSDLSSGRERLDRMVGLVACGGFSYGDVLGAGQGWAKSILFSPFLREAFGAFFARPDTFTLGVCNGCQMLSHLSPLIPGAEDFPRFMANRSERFEARLSMVEVGESPSILLAGMAGSRMPIAVAHGEGRAHFQPDQLARLQARGGISLRFVDDSGAPAQRYPQNPNGSIAGITGVTSGDGRVTLMMPHPERVFRRVQFSHTPPELQGESPWLRLFDNARMFVG